MTARKPLFFALTVWAACINSCQTLDAGYGPGNSANSLLVIIDKGIVELKIYRKIIEYKEPNDDNNKRDMNAWDILEGVLEAVREEPEPIRLSAGDNYSHYLTRDERTTLTIKPIQDGESKEPVEVIIQYRGREKKYTLRTNILSKSFAYIGG